MKSLPVLIFIFPIIVSAQSSAVMHPAPSRAHELKIQSISCYDSMDGSTDLLERRFFDELGRPTGSLRRHSQEGSVKYIHDTIFYYPDRIVFYTYNGWIDSTVSYLAPGINGERISREYDDGKIIRVHRSGGDTLNRYEIREAYRNDSLLSRSISRSMRTYDNSGREISCTRIDSFYYKQLKIQERYDHSETFYAGDTLIRSDFKTVNGRQTVWRRSYWLNECKTDSTIRYDEKGKIVSFHVHHDDSLNRTIDFYTMNKRRKITELVTCTYHHDSIVNRNFDGRGHLDITGVHYLNSKGLEVRHTINGIEGPYELWYEYTYYE